LPLGTDLGEGNCDVRLGSLQYAASGFGYSTARVDEREPLAMVDNPDIFDPEGQIFFDLFLNVFGAIIFREDFYKEMERRG